MKVFVLRNVDSNQLHYAETVHFVTFNQWGHGESFAPDLVEQCSVVLDLNGIGGFGWQTTCVKEIFENTPDHKHFRTQNTEYMLTKTEIKNETISNGKRHN
jgi:hypothetical protein